MICSICKSKRVGTYLKQIKSVYSDVAYDILHCPDCDHYFTEPNFTKEDLDDIYTNRYSYDAHSLIDREKRMRAHNYAKYIAALPAVKHVLEVGCMHGLLLQQLISKGVEASGVELDPEAVKYCKSIGLDVTQSPIEEHLKHTTDKIDAIVMSHVIEHIVDPIKQLTELGKRMPKNGKLILITPNSNARSRKVFGRFWGYWQVPVHINHFNEHSMQTMLETCGYEVTNIKYYGGDSLFFLSTLANALGSNKDTKQLSLPKKVLVKIASFVFGPWYHLGKEDMVVVAQKATADR